MKRNASWALVFAVVLAYGAPAAAFDLLGKWNRDGTCRSLDSHRLPDCGTCDDYCRKTMPKVRPPLSEGCCDDYCAKPIPLVRMPCLDGCRDDYCRKPLPCPTGPSCGYPDYYQFGPPDQHPCRQPAEPACINR
ncbi:MAG: hypothetical protein ACC645_21045 [Pirellulales bacterium]